MNEIDKLECGLIKFKAGEYDIDKLTEEANAIISAANENLKDIIAKSRYDLAFCQNTSEEPFRITFFGRFKTGKSSLINAILGTDILPVKAKRATAVNACIRRRITNGEIISSIKENEIAEPATFQTSRDFITDFTADNNNKNIPEASFMIPLEWLADDAEITDTPGMEFSEEDEKIALDAIKKSDIAVYVFSADSFCGQKEEQLAKKIYKMLGGNIVLAVNCINRLNSLDDLLEVQRIAHQKFGVLLCKMFFTCSLPDKQTQHLDNIDFWLKELLSNDEVSKRNRIEIRKRANRAKLIIAKVEAIRNLKKVIRSHAEIKKSVEKIQPELKEARTQKLTKEFSEKEPVKLFGSSFLGEFANGLAEGAVYVYKRITLKTGLENSIKEADNLSLYAEKLLKCLEKSFTIAAEEEY